RYKDSQGAASADSRVRPGPRPDTTLRPLQNHGSRAVSDTTPPSLPITIAEHYWDHNVLRGAEHPARHSLATIAYTRAQVGQVVASDDVSLGQSMPSRVRNRLHRQ